MMLSRAATLLACIAHLGVASPVPAVMLLKQDYFEEAHQRDDGATRAYEDIQIKTSDGRCLWIDPLSGDYAGNNLPIQITACGGLGQGWDIITKGKHHDNESETMLVVSTQTQGCMHHNKRRKETNVFSCGGIANGTGTFTKSQLFAFKPDTNTLTLEPQDDSTERNCFAAEGNRLNTTLCVDDDPTQLFTLGDPKTGGKTVSNMFLQPNFNGTVIQLPNPVHPSPTPSPSPLPSIGGPSPPNPLPATPSSSVNASRGVVSPGIVAPTAAAPSPPASSSTSTTGHLIERLKDAIG